MMINKSSLSLYLILHIFILYEIITDGEKKFLNNALLEIWKDWHFCTTENTFLWSKIAGMALLLMLSFHVISCKTQSPHFHNNYQS